MENRKTPESDINSALTKAKSSKSEKPKTDHPLAEKDEVKQAEENMRKRKKTN